MLHVIALAAVIGGGSPDEGRQQLREGARVRILITEDSAGAIATASKRPLVGRLVSIRSESLTLDTSGAPLIVPFKDMATLEVSHRSRNLKRGALFGGLIGFAAVTAVCIAVFDPDDDLAISTGDSFALGALFGAPGGGLIGLGIGALAPAWRGIPVPGTAASGRNVSLSLKISF